MYVVLGAVTFRDKSGEHREKTAGGFLEIQLKNPPVVSRKNSTEPKHSAKNIPQIFLILRDTPCLHNLLSEYLIPIQHRFKPLNGNLTLGDITHKRAIVLIFRAI